MTSENPIERLILELGRLPGIGKRSAMRLAHFILRISYEQREKGMSTLAHDLSYALAHADECVQLCLQCRNLCTSDFCSICSDSKRDMKTLCVVEGVAEIRAFESSRIFHGCYHVLHGVLSPLDGMGPEALGTQMLIERVQAKGIEEIIVATNASVEGDATAMYLARLFKDYPLKVTRLATGIPIGGELEFLDSATLERALSGRHAI